MNEISNPAVDYPVDPAFATLIRDLEDRELLDKTIVMWLGEFGRTPKINENEGRDHFASGWSLVLGGGGIRGGQVIGSTSEDGMKVVDQPVSVQDIFVSLCASFGIDHNSENWSRVGRPIRVVNGGNVIKGLFA